MKNSSSRKLLPILFILVALTSFASADFDDVVTYIYSVSTDSSETASTWRSLSLEGGAYLWIKGSGFSTDSADSNLVTVGGYQCGVISFLTTSTQIVCEAPAMATEGSYQVKVEVDGLRIATCGSCYLYYSYYNTPQLRYLIPNAAIPGDEIYYIGVQFVDDSTEVDYIKMGDFRCDATNQNEFDAVTFANSYSDSAPCSVSDELEAGKYTVTQRNLENTGYAQIMNTVATYSFKSDPYDFLVVPSISSISNNIGSAEGQIITITGTGFSSTEDNTVSLGDTVCEITSQSTTEIVCEVQARSTAVPSQGFHSGLKYELYPAQTLAAVQAGTAGTPNTTTSKLTAEIPQDLGTYFVAKMSGYFKAPKTGNYQFTVSGDDEAYLYISTTPLDKTTTELAVGITSYSAYRFYNTKGLNQTSDDIPLTANSFYYVEMYHRQYSGSEYATFGVRIPGVTDNEVNYVPEVQQITINADVVYEVIDFTLDGVSGGTWQIALGQLSSNKKYVESYDYTTSMSYKVAASSVASAISSAFSLSTSVVRTLYASNGTVTEDITQATTFVYTVTFLQLRKNGVLPEIESSLSGGTTKVTQTTAPSDAISGTFTVAYGAKSASLDADASTYEIMVAMRTLGFSDPIQVIQAGNTDFGGDWRIQFTGNAGDTMEDLIVTPSLKGGKTGGTISMSVNVLQESSTDLYYQVIPTELLFTADDVSQITVTSNSIRANCPDFNCDYALQTTGLPEIASASFSSPTLTLTIDGVSTGDYTKSDIRVFFANIECTVSSYTDSSIPATLLASCSGAEAGTFTPRVHFGGLGYATTGSSVNAIVVPITISNISPTQVNPNGGTVFTVTGTGFPASAATATTRGMTIKIGSAVCTASAVTATSITCTNAAVSSAATLDVSLNGQSGSSSTTLSILANPPTISSISPTSVNPVLQTDITITGTNFDTDKTSTTVYLGNSTVAQVTDCLVISSTSTEINPFSWQSTTFMLLGANTDTYNLYVQTSLGYSNSETLLVRSVVTSISPTTGSTAGGTLITISGGTFSDLTTQTLVFIGDGNIVCDVVSSSATAVTCTTEPLSDTSLLGTAQTVYVDTRIVEEAVCTGSCSFTYSDSATPKVTAISATTLYPGDSLTLTGSGFGSGTPAITINDVSCTVTSNSATSITFTVPTDFTPSASANISVNADGIGYAVFDSAISSVVSIPPKLSSISPSSGSTAGVLLTLTGTGFVDGTTVKVGSGTCVIRSLTATSIVCKATTSGTVKISYGDFSSQACVSGTCSVTTSSGLTPAVSAISPLAPTSAASFTLTVTGTQLTVATPSVTLFSTADSTISFVGSVTSSSATQVVATFTDVAAGTYSVEVAAGTNLATYASTVVVPLTASIPSVVSTSLNGGSTLTISGTGFFDNTLKSNNQVTICGFACEVTSSTASSIECTLPPFINPAVLDAYPTIADSETLTAAATWSDAGTESNVFDMTFTTTYTSTLTDCEIGWDAGENLLASVSEISFFPNPAITSNTLSGTVIEGSLDNSTYTTISTLDANTYDGWNIIKLDTNVEYRYYRFRGADSTAKCNIAELKYFGVRISDSTVTNLNSASCSAVVTVGSQTQETSTAVQYKQSLTANVTSVTPSFGTSAGSTPIVIAGSGFDDSDISKISVDIDGIVCTVSAATTTSITCTTGAAPAVANRVSSIDSTLTVSFETQGDAVVNGIQYLYIDRWSEDNTWGGITPPREGESVSIPAGQTILLDTSPPKLKALIIEGALIFEDADLTLDADYIIIRNGRMQIGTWDNPIQNQITITIHGTRDDAQLPTFGNKVIALMEGYLDIHGKQRSHTWTELETTAAVGATSIVVQGAVDWVAGEHIVIASTDHDHFQSEDRYIASVSASTPSAGYTTLTLTEALEYEHYAGIQTVDGITYEMRAEVGLLTRNVVIQGDDQSETLQYGVHIMAHSDTGDDSSVARISYTEVRQAGQAFNLGRYPIHFHLIGNVRESYVYGNAVHHTYNRAITIHGVHFLKVQWNVAFWCKGHTIFIEDGIETHNVIEDNLVISTRRSTALLDTDQTPASFWITNPNNIWRRNHAAGSDRYGFWFDLREHPTGPSATNSICPTGVQLGEFTDNVAHSNLRYGLRIFHELSPRTYPCNAYEPFDENPPIPAEFTNFFGWKNMRNAVIGETMGAVTFKNIRAANNLRVGIEISNADVSPAGTLVIEDCYIVGVTPDNCGDYATYQANEVKGLVTPRKDNLYVKNILFSNFNGAMSAIGTCSHCEHPAATDAGARTSYFSGLTFNNVTQRVSFNVPYKEILIDQDGSLTGNTNGGVVTYYWDHLNVDGCTRNEAVYNGLVCDDSVTIRRVEISGLEPSDSFYLENIQVLNDQGNSPGVFSEIPYRKANDSWAIPFVTGYTYNISWASQADFTDMTIGPGKLIETTDAAITLVFNHSDYRETFDVTGNTNDTALSNVSIPLSDISNSNKVCGDWYHDVDNRLLYINVNGVDEQDLVVESVTCRVNCPTIVTADKDGVIRVWSNATQWPNEVIPQDGDDVEIPAEWTLVLDVDTASLGALTIKGDLYFNNSEASLTLTAATIWVQGQLFIGNSSDDRYTSEATIVLTGVRSSPSLIMGTLLDPSNKVMGVTGNVTMYGNEVTNVYVRLQAPANVGDTIISLPSTVDWQVGDEIVLAPSQLSPDEFEKHTITAISAGQVTLDSAIKYYHFGAATTTKTTAYGPLDMRTEVALLTRNIIVKGSSEGTWGGRIYVAELYDQTVDYYYRGRLEIDGIEMINLSQPNTTWAGLTFDALTSSNNGDSIVTRSVMRDSLGWMVRFVGTTGVTMDQNVFYWSWQYQIKAEDVNTNIVFTNNLAIANQERGLTATEGDNSYDLASAWYAEDIFSNSDISNNIFAGCEQQCMIAPGDDCSSSTTYTYSNNVAHSGYNGWLLDAPNTVCNGVKGFTAYKLQAGLTTCFASKAIKVSNLIFSDNVLGTTLNIGGITSVPTTVSLTDSYFAGLSLVSTPSAYSNTDECSNLGAVMVPLSIESAQTIPPMPSHLPWHSAHSNAIFQSTFTVSGLTFENFDDSLVSGCTGNHLFESNPYASDASATTSVTDITLSNVSDDNLVFFSGPDDGWITIDNCGSWYCTGIYNILIRDLDGTLTGDLTSIMPIHSGIYDSNTCTSSPSQNAYFCTSPQWAQLTFDSQDTDATTRPLSPINITNSDGYRNDLNNFQDHAWDGFYTSLKRLSRYPAVVQAGKDYSVRFTSTVPNVVRWQLQGGLDTETVTVQYAYQTTQSVRITDGNGNLISQTVIAPSATGVSTLASLTTCGANTHETTSMQVTIRLTGASDCVLLASLANSIKISVRYDISVADFYSQSGTTEFIDRIAAILGINPASIRVVQVVSGSSIVNAYVDSSIQGSDSDSITAANEELTAYIKKLEKSDVSILGAKVLNTSYKITLIEPMSSDDTSSSKKTQTVVIIVASVVGFLALAVGVYFFYTRYYKKKVISQDRFVHKIENTMQKLNYQSMVINTENPINKSKVDSDLVSPSPLVDVSHGFEAASPSYRPTGSPLIQSKRDSEIGSSLPIVSRSIHSDFPLSKFKDRRSRLASHVGGSITISPLKKEEDFVFSVSPDRLDGESHQDNDSQKDRPSASNIDFSVINLENELMKHEKK